MIDDIEYAKKMLDTVDTIIQDVYQVVVKDSEKLVGDDKLADSEAILASIKTLLDEYKEKTIDFSLFDRQSEASSTNALFNLKTQLQILKSKLSS